MVVVAFALCSSPPEARGGGRAVTFVAFATVPIRLQVAFSPVGTTPCDSSDNEMLFDGVVDPKAPLALMIERSPICVRHTFDDFPESNWGRSALWYRRLPSPMMLEAHVTRE